MRTSIARTSMVLFAGAVVGTLAGQLLARQIPALGRSTVVRWHPSADMGVLSYSFDLVLRVNWLTLVGFVAAYFIYRRMK